MKNIKSYLLSLILLFAFTSSADTDWISIDQVSTRIIKNYYVSKNNQTEEDAIRWATEACLEKIAENNVLAVAYKIRVSPPGHFVTGYCDIKVLDN